MSPMVRGIVKNVLLFAAAGALLALAAPMLGPAVGVTLAQIGISANPAWSALFFGAFGALTATIGPMIDAVMGQPQQAAERSMHVPEQARSKSLARSMEQEYEADLSNAHNPSHVHAARVLSDRQQSSAEREL